MKKETAKNIENKLFKKLRKTVIWTCGDGREVHVKEMEVSHLQNTIIFLAKRQEECDTYKLGAFVLNELSASEWIELFREELIHREVITE